ncbi:MAG: hypothetical protein IPI40_04150 [Betaproteobacteria bacterium]|nr:hypothetical protein [Betaproteobacteria bacterium]
MIWIWSAEARYSAVTPKRPDATCLIFERSESPSRRMSRPPGGGVSSAIAAGVLAAFAGVRLAADAVHRQRQRRVRLGRDRAQAHRAGREAPDDLGRGLDFGQRHRHRRLAEREQAAQRHLPLRLVVDQRRVLLVRRIAVGPRRVLQLGDRVRRPQVVLAADPVLVFAAGVERAPQERVVAERLPVQPRRLLGDLEQADALDVARGAGEVLVDELALQPDRLEDLRAAVGLVGRDAHLGHHLVQALADRLDVALLGLVGGDLGHPGGQRLQRLQREVGVDRLGTVARQQREVVDLARRAGLDHEAGAGAQALAHEVLVDGCRREQRRDRQQPGRHLAVGDDQDVVAEVDRVLGLGGQRRDRRLHAVAAPGRRIADAELVGLERSAAEQADVADLLHRVAGEHRLLRLETHRRRAVDGEVDGEQVRPRADEGDQRHHELFADRVDRRVGHLREQLLEVAVQRLRPRRQHGQRGVVAHRARRLLARLRHRREDDLEVLLRVAERLLAIEQRHLGRLRRRRVGQLVERDARALDPLPVGPGRGQRALQFVVVDDPALLHVDEQHLARLQAPLLDDLALGDVEHADLGGHHDVVVVGDDEARRAQAVAVERRADLAAVGEGHRGRAVPRLHQRGVVLVERAPVLVHQRIAGPGLGDHHHHRVRQRVAAHHQQLDGVVERGRVGLAVVDQRPDLVEVVAEHRARDAVLARRHPVDVAAQRVDFAVVADHAERMREVPGGEGVGREALVHHRQRGHHRLVAQVEEVLADLVREQHPLVDERPRRHRRDVELLAVAQLQRLDRVAGLLADDVELALQRVLVHGVAAAGDEHLADDRLDLLGPLRQAAVVRRHVAPAEQDLPFAGDRALDLLLAGHPRRRLLRQEDHAHAVLPDGGKGETLPPAGAAQERVRQLDQDAGAVALQRVGAGRAAVGEVPEYQQRLIDDRVRLLTLDVGDEAEPASVVLVGRIVQTLTRRRHVVLTRGSCCHVEPRRRDGEGRRRRGSADRHESRRARAKPINTSVGVAMRQAEATSPSPDLQHFRQAVASAEAKHLHWGAS